MIKQKAFETIMFDKRTYTLQPQKISGTRLHFFPMLSFVRWCSRA